MENGDEKILALSEKITIVSDYTATDALIIL